MLSKRAHKFDIDLDYLNTYSVDRALRDPYDRKSNPNVSTFSIASFVLNETLCAHFYLKFIEFIV